MRISREEIKKITNDYDEIFKKESHHDHKIINDDHSTLRWEENNDIRKLLLKISMNDLISLLGILGCGKNSEVYRNLYRNMGYSLSGYWEIFYWEINNEECENYSSDVCND